MLGALLDLRCPDRTSFATRSSPRASPAGRSRPSRWRGRGCARRTRSSRSTTTFPPVTRRSCWTWPHGLWPEQVSQFAVRAIRSVAETEAKIHDSTVEKVHLHELGGVDTIVDTVGVAAALAALDITAVYSGAVGLGIGQTHAAHGLLPVPAPATPLACSGARVSWEWTRTPRTVTRTVPRCSPPRERGTVRSPR